MSRSTETATTHSTGNFAPALPRMLRFSENRTPQTENHASVPRSLPSTNLAPLQSASLPSAESEATHAHLYPKLLDTSNIELPASFNALQQATDERDDYILACRFDQTETPSMAVDVAYQDLTIKTSEQIAHIVVSKLR